MSKRTLAAALLLATLTTTLPAAEALPARYGPCLTAGDPPDRLPTAATGDCGPKVLLRLLTPAGSLHLEVNVGSCQEECGVTVILEIILCSPPPRAPVSDPMSPVEAEWGPLVEGALDSLGDEIERPVESRAPVVIEMETALDCD